MSDLPICVVAGAGPGIGIAVARRFAREGFAIALLARRAEALDGFAQEINASGGHARGYPVDLADPAVTRDTLGRVERELGAPAVLVYNAAFWREADPMTLDPALFAADLSLNVTGALACAQAVYPAMRAAGSGTMLITGGGLALRPEYGASVISLTAGKAAIRGLALALAPALAKDGIHVATVTVAGQVAPGTALDPDRVADAFWSVHQQRRSEWSPEVVLTGEG